MKKKINIPKVSIIILNWNGWKDTIECLESTFQIDYPNYNIILVDNDSQDDSLLKIKEYCMGKIKVQSDFFNFNQENKPIDVIEYSKNGIEPNIADIRLKSPNSIFLIKNNKNYGFAEGNNIGIKFSMDYLNPDYVFLLNNDTVVYKNFLKELIKIAENDDRIGIIGPLVYYYEKPARISVFGGNINLIGKTSYPDLNKEEVSESLNKLEIDYISGCSLMIKKDTLENIGFLNKSYFLYYEDTELCFRARKEGYKVFYTPKAKIWHKTSPSSISSTGIYYLTRNRFWLLKTYFSKINYMFFLILFFFSYFWYHTFRHLFYYKDIERLSSFYKGIIDGITTNSQ